MKMQVNWSSLPFALLSLLPLILTLHRSEGRPSSSSSSSSSSSQVSPPVYEFPFPVEEGASSLQENGVSEEDWELRETILEELGFPQQQQQLSQEPITGNITRAEYKRAYREYMLNVRTRRDGERGERQSASDRRKKARLHRQSIPPLNTNTRNSNATAEHVHSQETILVFPWTPHGQDTHGKERILVKRATLFLPSNCTLTDERQSSPIDMTRRVIRWMEEVRMGRESNDLSVPLTCPKASSDMTAWEEPLLEVLWLRTPQRETMASMLEGHSRQRRRRAVHGHRFGGHDGAYGFGQAGKRSGNHLEVSDFQDGGNDTRGKNRRLGKRRGKDCRDMKHGKSCCRKSQMVSFEDLKITEIILAPLEFDMGYCEGRCQAKRLPYANNHAIFQAILLRNKGKDFAPKLCCTPTKFSEVDVIQRDPLRMDQLKVTVIRNARVKECGCS